MRKLLLIGILLFGWASAALAADSSVPNMTAGGAMSDTDLIYCAQSGGTTDRKCTGAQIKTYATTSAVDARTTTTEAISNSDQSKLVTFTNASAVACTIAQAGTGGNFTAGWAVSLKNSGAGTVTCTPTTSTIDGASTLVLTTGQGVDLYSDGSNYFTQPGKGSGTVTTTGSPTSGNLTKFSGSSSITSGDLSGDCTTSGTLTANCGLYAPNYQVSSWYFVNGSKSAATGSASSLNRIGCAPINFPTKLTLGAIGAHIQTVGTTNIQIALYTQGTDGLPNTQIAATGSIVDTAAGPVSGAISAQVGPGSANGQNLFACFNAGDAAVAFTAVSASDPSYGFFLGTPTAAALWNSNTSALLAVGISCAGANCNGASSTFGTWPASLHASTWTYDTTAVTGVFFPILMFQVASVP